MPDYLELDKSNKDKEQELLSRELQLREKALGLAEKALDRVAFELSSGTSLRAANCALIYAALTGAAVSLAPQESR